MRNTNEFIDGYLIFIDECYFIDGIRDRKNLSVKTTLVKNIDGCYLFVGKYMEKSR